MNNCFKKYLAIYLKWSEKLAKKFWPESLNLPLLKILLSLTKSYKRPAFKKKIHKFTVLNLVIRDFVKEKCIHLSAHSFIPLLDYGKNSQFSFPSNSNILSLSHSIIYIYNLWRFHKFISYGLYYLLWWYYTVLFVCFVKFKVNILNMFLKPCVFLSLSLIVWYLPLTLFYIANHLFPG